MKIFPQRKKIWKTSIIWKIFKNVENIGRGKEVGENPSLPDLPIPIFNNP